MEFWDRNQVVLGRGHVRGHAGTATPVNVADVPCPWTADRRGCGTDGSSTMSKMFRGVLGPGKVAMSGHVRKMYPPDCIKHLLCEMVPWLHSGSLRAGLPCAYSHQDQAISERRWATPSWTSSR